MYLYRNNLIHIDIKKCLLISKSIINRYYRKI